MIIELPHLLDFIVRPVRTASEIMRGWMELVNRNISNENRDSQTTDITTSGNAYIRATAPITITLNPDAVEDEGITVHMDSSTGDVTVTDGNGTDILWQQGTVISYRYKLDEGWVRGA